MRAVGDQVKIACGNLQLCAGLEAEIEGATHDVVLRRLDRERARRREQAAEGSEEKEVVETLNNLTTERTGTEEETA